MSRAWPGARPVLDGDRSSGRGHRGRPLLLIIATAACWLTLVMGAAASPDQGSWRALAPVPSDGIGVEGMAVGHVGGSIVGAYGYDSGDTRATRLYDVRSDTWSTGALAPRPRRSEPTAVVQGGSMYVLGGRRADVLAAVERYAVKADSWTSMPDMPTPRAGLAAAVVGRAMYAIGGRTQPGGPCSQGPGGQLATVERFDLTTETWTTVASLPNARSDLAAAALGGKVYVFGGCRVTREGIRFLDRVDVYDPSTDSWSTTPSDLPTARAAMYSVATRAGSVHVIGGWAGRGPLGVHEVYSPALDAYEPAAALLTPRAEMGVVSARGKVYAVGGALPAFGESSPANEVFTP